MIDYKNDILKSIERSLITKLDNEQVEEIINIVMKILFDYEITKKQNKENKNNSNEEILDMYSACLMVEGKSEKTIYQYKRSCKKLSDFIQKPFPQINTYDIRCFLASEKQRGISNSTLENLRSNISAFFSWMYNEKLTTENMMSSVRPIKVAADIKKSFSDVEIDMLRTGCKSLKDRALVEFLLSSGVRVEQLSEMKIEDVNMQTLAVYIKHGKGDKERITYINPVAREHLKKYLDSRKDKLPYLFINKNYKQLQTDGIIYILKEIAKRANVENVHPHRFRRTFATNLAAKGMDIQAIQKLLGHSKIDTTLRYVFTDDTKIKALYDRYIN